MAIYLGIDEGGCLDVKSMKGGRPLYVRELTSDLDPLGPCGRVTALHLSYFVKLQGNTRTHNSHSKVKQKKIIVMNIKYSCTSSQSSLWKYFLWSIIRSFSTQLYYICTKLQHLLWIGGSMNQKSFFKKQWYKIKEHNHGNPIFYLLVALGVEFVAYVWDSLALAIHMEKKDV